MVCSRPVYLLVAVGDNIGYRLQLSVVLVKECLKTEFLQSNFTKSAGLA